ncbi:MAG: hypothetical protein Q9M75_04900 [Ghiorsea sp.]|nr:hypothetical protein [Ghiorsea sp.]
MSDKHKKRCGVVRIIIGIVAVVFGFLTIKSGGAVLFWSEEARIAAGDYVPFVLWFNFISGFFYIIAGIAFWLNKSWSLWLAAAILVGIISVFMALGLSILIVDVPYESRTIGAMVVRTTVWSVILFLAYKIFQHRSDV